MLKNKLLLLALFIAFCVPLIAGCGNQNVAPQTEVAIVDQNTREARLGKFDNQLADIKDEDSAKVAINTFANYVEGEAANSVSASSVRVFSVDRIDRLAKLELAARRNILSGMKASDTASAEGVISLDQVAAALNTAKDPSLPEIKKEDVEFIQAGIRSELPNIAPTSADNTVSVQSLSGTEQSAPSNVITPTEALVIGYVVASGDDGSAGPGSCREKLPQDQVNTFLDKVTE
jgi:hypothetical protein